MIGLGGLIGWWVLVLSYFLFVMYGEYGEYGFGKWVVGLFFLVFVGLLFGLLLLVVVIGGVGLVVFVEFY